MEEGALDPMLARMEVCTAYFSDTSKTVNLTKASELFGDLPKYEHVLIQDPGLFMRVGLLELICNGGPAGSPTAVGTAEAAEEVRFGLSDGRCVDPGRLLFGRAVPTIVIAQRLGMEGNPGFKDPAVTPAQRVGAELDVLVRIGKGIWG